VQYNGEIGTWEQGFDMLFDVFMKLNRGFNPTLLSTFDERFVEVGGIAINKNLGHQHPH
jgi:hypothetical protein